MPEPIEFVVFDDFDLIFLVDDVIRHGRELQFERFRVLALDAEKGDRRLDFHQPVAFEERDAAPGAREPVAERAHERRNALFGRQPF